MDGFAPSETVIVVAATNRPDVLDPALLRPGRFDRHITVDRPSDRRPRGAARSPHPWTFRSLKTPSISQKLARATVGHDRGRHHANLVNEAALWATRQGKAVRHEADDFEYARDKALMGSPREKTC